jgi:hypothetical protein
MENCSKVVGVVRGLFYGTVQNCPGDSEERHAGTMVHYLTGKDIG